MLFSSVLAWSRGTQNAPGATITVSIHYATTSRNHLYNEQWTRSIDEGTQCSTVACLVRGSTIANTGTTRTSARVSSVNYYSFFVWVSCTNLLVSGCLRFRDGIPRWCRLFHA